LESKRLVTSRIRRGEERIEVLVELMLLKEGMVDPASTGLKDSQINESMFAQGIASIMISGEPGRLGQMNDPKQSKVAGQVEAILVPTASGETRSFG
ncbi:sugar ABC transporter substrate-binding protein, partial [Rhizobium leguminosarum]